jgi:hypothetical protein
MAAIARDSKGLSDETIAWVVGGCADKFFNLK